MSDNLEKQTVEKGRKVFFLYPHSVIKDELVNAMIRMEYEIYLIKNHQKLIKLLNVYNDAILFINIDEKIKDIDWEVMIKEIMQEKATINVKIGVLSYDADQELKEKYLVKLMVPCGFIQLKLGIIESTKIILKALEANEAKGRRKYVRACCGQKNTASFNAQLDQDYKKGVIIDISSVGMSIEFDQEIKLQKKALLDDVQLRLKGILCKVSGIIVGFRKEGSKTRYILMFDPHLKMEIRDKIRSFIFQCLQDNIKEQINKI